MATAAQQAAFRARDSKVLVQIRLTTGAVETLDAMVKRRKLSGRAEAVEALLNGEPAAAPAPSPARPWLGWP